jgi:gamma-glutamyl:cysteine ligase YbdK (ATP-grasp superfamily)
VSPIDSIKDYYTFIGFVVLTAPDKFPRRDWRPLEEQLTLANVYERLRNELEPVAREVGATDKLKELREVLERSLAAYKTGDDVKGAHLLQDLRSALFEGVELE